MKTESETEIPYRLQVGRKQALEEIREAFDLPEGVDPVEIAIGALWHMVEIYRRAGHRKLVFVPYGDSGLTGIVSRDQWIQAQKLRAEQELGQADTTLN